jgi:hypothetical protein
LILLITKCHKLFVVFFSWITTTSQVHHCILSVTHSLAWNVLVARGGAIARSLTMCGISLCLLVCCTDAAWLHLSVMPVPVLAVAASFASRSSSPAPSLRSLAATRGHRDLKRPPAPCDARIAAREGAELWSPSIWFFYNNAGLWSTKCQEYQLNYFIHLYNIEKNNIKSLLYNIFNSFSHRNLCNFKY